jgi:uncharacterized protein YcaQ
VTEISLAEARRIAIAAQGLHRRAPQSRTPDDILASVGCIQLDAISVVRRSHELVLLARGAGGDQAAIFPSSGNPPRFFEYWAHAVSLIPLSWWPLLAFRRRAFAAKGWRGPNVDPQACDHVRKILIETGQATVTDLGGAHGSGWQRDAPVKWAAEWLLATGEAICVQRRGFTRVYQMTSAVLPQQPRSEPADEDCIHELCGIALDALGVATAGDVADYFRLPPAIARDHLAHMTDAEAVHVQGWDEPAWMRDTAAGLPEVDEQACTPLSPFDSLVWHRPRARRLFGIDYLLEAYKPAAQRQCGYFGMPVLAGDKIAGRIALRARNGTAHLEGYQVVNGYDLSVLRQAARTAATWAGAHTLRADQLRQAAGAQQ